MIVIESVLSSSNESTFSATGYWNSLFSWHNCKIIKKETDLHFGLVGHDTDRFSGSMAIHKSIRVEHYVVDKDSFLPIFLKRKKFHSI